MFTTIRFTVRKSAVGRYPDLVGGLTSCADHADDLRGHAHDLLVNSEGDILRFSETVSEIGTCPVCQSRD